MVFGTEHIVFLKAREKPFKTICNLCWLNNIRFTVHLQANFTRRFRLSLIVWNKPLCCLPIFFMGGGIISAFALLFISVFPFGFSFNALSSRRTACSSGPARRQVPQSWWDSGQGTGTRNRLCKKIHLIACQKAGYCHLDTEKGQEVKPAGGPGMKDKPWEARGNLHMHSKKVTLNLGHIIYHERPTIDKWIRPL